MSKQSTCVGLDVHDDTIAVAVVQGGAITKAGSSHLRRVLVESAFHYRHRPKPAKRQRELQPTLPPQVAAMAWKAQERLHRRYWLLTSKGSPRAKW
jgi:transposase